LDKATSVNIDRILNLIRDYKIVLWAGSGLSLYAGYPSAKMFSQAIIENADTSEHRNILARYENSLMDITNEFVQLYSRERLIELVKTKFDVAPQCEPSTHLKISKIPQIKTIITTNYDHLFEIAYANNSIVYVGTNFKKSEKDKVDIYKIHGDTTYHDSIVLTNKDYSQFYDKLDTILWNKVKSILAEKSFIFVGYSLEDKNIQDIFEKVLSQIDSSDNEFFIVTPELHEHKLRALNQICKTTHIPLTGQDFIEYIEKGIRQNILLDAIAKKTTIDEAYKVCRESGITPTIKSLPSAETTKPIVEKIELSTEAYLDYLVFPDGFGRGFNLTLNPKTYEQVINFIENCDCKELEVPAEDVTMFRDINGINIPENQMINGKFPDVVRLVKEEIVDKLKIRIDSKEINIVLRGYCGSKKSRFTIELLCMNIEIVREGITTNYQFSFRYPHNVKDAISDLEILQIWANGTSLEFINRQEKPEFILQGIPNESCKKINLFIDEHLTLYQKLICIEEKFGEQINLNKKLTRKDLGRIFLTYCSIIPQIVKYNGFYEINVGDMSLENLRLYQNDSYSMRITIEYPEVLPDDCFNLFDRKICLGKRKITLMYPFISNMEEAEKNALEKKPVKLRFESRTQEATLAFV
jgi:hypothetical protein